MVVLDWINDTWLDLPILKLHASSSQDHKSKYSHESISSKRAAQEICLFHPAPGNDGYGGGEDTCTRVVKVVDGDLRPK